MAELSPATINTLLDLFRAAGTDVSIVVPIKTRDLNDVELLMQHRLVVLEQDADERWYAMLTPAGRQFAMSYYGLEDNDVKHLRPRQTLKLPFDLTNKFHQTTLEQLQAMDAQHIVDLICHLVAIHEQLLAGDVSTFLERYPVATESMRVLLAREMQEQAQNRDSAQIARLLEEIETVKSLLRHTPPTTERARPTPEEHLRGLDKLQLIAPTSEVGLRQINAPTFEAPKYDDEDSSELFVVQVDMDAGRRAAENFLKSLSSLQPKTPSTPES